MIDTTTGVERGTYILASMDVPVKRDLSLLLYTGYEFDPFWLLIP